MIYIQSTLIFTYLKTTLMTILLICLMCSSAKSQTHVPKGHYTAQQIREDLRVLYATLQQSHYNLFVHTSKDAYDRAYRKVRAKVKDHMSLMDANRLFQPFVALGGLAHCNIAFPFRPAYLEYLKKGGKVFPLDITVEERRMIVSNNHSGNPAIKAGDQILLINGKPAAYSLNGIYNYLSGENEAFKNTLIDLYHFSRLHWLVYGKVDAFKMRMKRPDGSTYECLAHGIAAEKLEEYTAKKKSIFDTSREFRNLGKIAYLRPGAFLNNDADSNTSEHRTFENFSFVRFIDSAFQQVRLSGNSKLIIDLRGNPGGDNSFSDHMLAYFAKEPFSFCSSFSVKTSAMTKSFWRNVTDTSLAELKHDILSRLNGTIFQAKIIKKQPLPDSLIYKGTVFVMINRYSYSNAVTTAATIKDYHLGMLIGESTADIPTTYAAVHEFKLPNTAMEVTYPKAFIVRPNGDRSTRVLEPDVKIPRAKDLRDIVLEKTIAYINTL